MWQGALALIPSFVLTVLIGGAYASYLQQRSWRHQNQTRLDEEERKQAGEICAALAQLLDKRRYRTVRLLQAIEDRARGEGPDDELGKRRSEYEQALADWNDQLTTRLVSVEVYFGGDAYDQLDSIDRRFQEADSGIEKLYRQLTAAADTAVGIDTDDVAAMTKLLDVVREEAHELGFGMMLHIRRGEIGHAAHYPRSAAGRQPSVDDPPSRGADPTKPGFGSYLGVGVAASQHPAAVLAAAMRNQREHADDGQVNAPISRR